MPTYFLWQTASAQWKKNRVLCPYIAYYYYYYYTLCASSFVDIYNILHTYIYIVAKTKIKNSNQISVQSVYDIHRGVCHVCAHYILFRWANCIIGTRSLIFNITHMPNVLRRTDAKPIAIANRLGIRLILSCAYNILYDLVERKYNI